MAYNKNSEQIYPKIQALVKKDAEIVATEVYKKLGTEFGVAEVPYHEHNGVDSPLLPFVNISGRLMVIDFTLPGTSPATAGNYGTFWTAPFPCTVIGFTEVHETAGTNGGAVTLQLERLQGTEAPDSGDALLFTAISLKATANTVQIGILKMDRSDGVGLVNLSAGNRLALKDAGTLTSVAGLSVAVVIQY